MFVGRSDLADFFEVRCFLGIHHPCYTHYSTGESVSIFYIANVLFVLFFLKTKQGSLGTARNLDGQSVDNGSVHLMDWVNSDTLSSVKMEQLGGVLFDLSMFDFTSGYLNGGSIASQLSVNGFDVGGNLIANSLFTVADYSHLSFTTLNLSQSFQGLSYVVFDALGSSNRVGYDNFVINETVPVPEPSALLVLGLGLAGIGFAKKKKSHKSN